MSRKSSWWLRPQRKGASNRAALNESKYFMEHNKVLRERIKELADENAKLRESLERAAGIIADFCGECPACRYEWLSSDSCAEKCWTVTEEECWIAYLTGKRWDESGVEVDV